MSRPEGGYVLGGTGSNRSRPSGLHRLLPGLALMAKDGREPGMPREDRQNPDQPEKDKNEKERGGGDQQENRRGEKERERGPDQRGERSE
jgi:hypothetical protein